jgi:hypothetical protein
MYLNLLHEAPHHVKVVVGKEELGFVGNNMTLVSEKKEAQTFEGNIVASLNEVRTYLNNKSGIVDEAWKKISGPIRFVFIPKK